MPTLLSMLLDSDTTTNRSNASRRADGLLGKLVEYDVAAGRPVVTETPWTVTPEPPDANAVNRLCYGLEQMTTGMKGAKAKGTQIYEDMSNTSGTITRVTKSMDPPEWLFQKRVRPDDGTKYIDMDLDDVLEGVIGASNTEGIRQFHDTNTGYEDGTGDPSWTDITNATDDGALDNIEFLINNFVPSPGRMPSRSMCSTSWTWSCSTTRPRRRSRAFSTRWASSWPITTATARRGSAG